MFAAMATIMALSINKTGMRKRWLILAAVMGSLVTAGIWKFPKQPLWRSGPDTGRVEGFSADGKTLVTVLLQATTDRDIPNPEICRWNARSGKLISRVEFPCTDPQSFKEVRLSADRCVALVGEGIP